MTIKDIAKESGYSVSTVSRVLNNRDDVSPEAEKKIRRIVAEHNFCSKWKCEAFETDCV